MPGRRLQSAPPDGLGDLGPVADEGQGHQQQEDEAEPADHLGHAEALEGEQLDGLDAGAGLHRAADVLEQALVGLGQIAGGLGQRQGLDEGQGPVEGLGPQHDVGGGHRPLGADQAGRGHEQLGHVGGQLQVVGSGLGPPEARQVRRRPVGDHDLVRGQAAVGDAGPVQHRHLGPDGGEELVGDLGGGHPVEGRAFDPVDGEDPLGPGGLAHGPHQGHRHPRLPGEEGGQGLVTDLAAGPNPG